MTKTNFTAARVDAFQCEARKAQAFLWDTRAPGLGLRATQAGAKSYVFQAKLDGATLRTTIGDVKTWTIAAAQEEARRLQTLVDRGVDPREEKVERLKDAHAKREQERRQAVTFGEAWDEYVESRKSHWGSRHHFDHVRLSAPGGIQRRRAKTLTRPGPLAALRPIRLGELTGERTSSWLRAEAAQRPTVSALAFRLFRAFVHWADDAPAYRGLIPKDACSARQVKESIPRVKAKEGDVLQREQLAAWFRGVRSLPNFVTSVYLRGLLLTGARREELAALTWADVDLEWRGLTLNDKVEGTGGRTVPLTPHFKELLLQLRRSDSYRRAKAAYASNKNAGLDWVFPSATSFDGKIAEPRSGHLRALKVGGLPHVTIHGLRRSFGTLSEWLEVPVGVVAQIQGHKPSAVAEKHYRRRPLDLLRKWHDSIESWIISEAKEHETST